MKIIHTADNHLDMPMTYLPPDKARVRQFERCQSFSEIIDYTLSKKADMLLIAGDLFHTPEPSEDIVAFCRDEFCRLGDIPVFISLGNHDCNPKGFDFPGNVRVFPPHITTLEGDGFTVTGASFSSPSAAFAQFLTPPCDKSRLNILCIHGDLSPNSTYNSIDKDTLSLLGFDYVALGHIHKSMVFHRMAYPGCHDGTGFDETGVKGFLECDIDKNLAQIRFIPSSYRIYEVLSFDISPYSSSNAVINALEEKMEEGIYKIILTGTPAEGFSPNIEYIRTVLSQKSFYVKIEEEYTSEKNISSSALYSLFADYIMESCDEEIRELALKLGTSALKGEEIIDD